MCHSESGVDTISLIIYAPKKKIKTHVHKKKQNRLTLNSESVTNTRAYILECYNVHGIVNMNIRRKHTFVLGYSDQVLRK